jgi:4-hydroxybenzoate polyprenyltransferase
VLALGGLPSLRVSLVGLVAAGAGFLAVFSLNDVLDRRVDAAALRAGKGEFAGFDIDTAFERHPLARGDLSLRFSLAWVLSLAALSAVLAYTLAPICLLLFGAAVALEVVYCALRSVTPWKTVVSGVMVGLGGVAGWAAVAPLSWRVLSVFGFLALWEIGGRNIANDLADIDADRSVGVKTVATVYGPAVAARAACIVGFATLASTVTLPMTAGLLSDLALVAGVLVVAWPGAKLWYRPTSAEAASYFNVASLYPAVVLVIALLPAVFGAL